MIWKNVICAVRASGNRDLQRNLQFTASVSHVTTTKKTNKLIQFSIDTIRNSIFAVKDCTSLVS